MAQTFFKSIKRSIKNWYIPVVLGVFFIIAGIYIFSTPIASYFSLAILFSTLFLVSGIFEIAFAISNKDELEGWGWLLFSGIVDVLLGSLLLGSPSLSLTFLPIYVGLVLMFRSMRGMGLAFDLKHYGAKGWGSLLFLGILGLIFSILMVTNLEFGAFTIVYWTAFTFVMLGVFSIFYGIQLKGLKNRAGKISEELKQKYEAIQEEIKKELNKE